MNVLDASALLAFLKDEPGANLVEVALLESATCSSVNWSETAQKILSVGADWLLAAAVLKSYSLIVEHATFEDAENAAALRSRADGLSLGDCFCIALGNRMNAIIWTADSAWAKYERVRLVR